MTPVIVIDSRAGMPTGRCIIDMDISKIPIILISITLSGCAGYSMHTMHGVELTIREYDDNSPAADLAVSVAYDYDSYGWFYFAQTPATIRGTTDSTGKVTFSLADYRYRILLRVADEFGDLDKGLITVGGVFHVPPAEPHYTVTLQPR